MKNKTQFLPYNSAVPLLGIYLKITETLIQKDTCISVFIAALFTVAKIWKQPKCPSTDEWIKKMRYIYMYVHTHTHTTKQMESGILHSHKKG